MGKKLDHVSRNTEAANTTLASALDRISQSLGKVAKLMDEQTALSRPRGLMVSVPNAVPVDMVYDPASDVVLEDGDLPVDQDGVSPLTVLAAAVAPSRCRGQPHRLLSTASAARRHSDALRFLTTSSEVVLAPYSGVCVA